MSSETGPRPTPPEVKRTVTPPELDVARRMAGTHDVIPGAMGSQDHRAAQRPAVPLEGQRVKMKAFSPAELGMSPADIAKATRDGKGRESSPETNPDLFARQLPAVSEKDIRHKQEVADAQKREVAKPSRIEAARKAVLKLFGK